MDLSQLSNECSGIIFLVPIMFISGFIFLYYFVIPIAWDFFTAFDTSGSEKNFRLELIISGKTSIVFPSIISTFDRFSSFFLDKFNPISLLLADPTLGPSLWMKRAEYNKKIADGKRDLITDEEKLLFESKYQIPHHATAQN